MKSLFTICLLFFALVSGAQSSPPIQQVFCRFIAAFNGQELNVIYEDFSPSFQATVDRAVCTGGLASVYRANGVVQSAAIAHQSIDEGIYYALAENGVFKVMLSVDSLQRIDGLRIQQIKRSVPMPLVSLLFKNDRTDLQPIR
jgi:hypothetical protein